VRGVALLGVLLANLVTAFRVSPIRSYLPADASLPFADRFAEGALEAIVQGKAIALFSMLFGVGLAIQHERFSRLGDPGRWLARRLLVLLAFGLAHLLLVWNGDILAEYALAGLLLVPLLGASDRTLARVAAGCYALYLVFPLLPFSPEWPDAAALAEELVRATPIYASGSWREIRRYSLHELRVFLPVYATLFPVTPALFLFGVLAWRSGVLRDVEGHRPLLARAATVGIALGAVLTALGAREGGLLAFLSAGAAPAVLATGYAAALFLALQSPGGRAALRAFAPAGRMAFTNYIAQSLVFGALFFGYGLGWVDRIGAAVALAGGFVAFALQMAFSAWWLRRFRFGPLEWLWRTFTYGRAQPMRRPA
jgi:uncharacterized protein